MNLPNRTIPAHLIWLAALAVLSAAGARASAQSAWWDSKWSCRRPVVLAAAATQAQAKDRAGDDVAWVVVPTGGLCRPDFADIRVATGARQEVPSAVLMTGPGDFAKVAFALSGRAGPNDRYYVYFGNRSPRAAAKALEIRRGVLMETKLHVGTPPPDLAGARTAFLRSRNLLGRAFVPRIYQGHNPFGSEITIVSRFTGWLDCPRDGTYQFACSSRDASFLLIDDKQVVANGGAHWPQRDIRKRASLRLSAGVHKLTFYHVNQYGDPVVVAAWRAPGEVRTWPIPATAFLPVTEGSCGPMEQLGRRASASFTAAAAGETYAGGWYYQRWSFEAAVAPRAGGKMSYSWDFGDGQKAQGASVEHVFLETGVHEVALTVLRGTETLTYRNKIRNDRLWEHAGRARLDDADAYAGIVAGYDFSALSAKANAWAVLLLGKTGNREKTVDAGIALLARRDHVPDRLLAEAMDAISAALPPDKRAEPYLRAEKLARTARLRSTMAVRAADVLLGRRADANAALVQYRRVVREYGADASLEAVRAAKVGIGDVWRVRGNLAEATRAYEAVGLGPEVEPSRVEIAKGGYARHVEQYLREGQFEFADAKIDEWALNIPADKLEGYWSLLVVRKCLAQKAYAAAAREAEVLVTVNPRSNYAAELLMKAAEAHEKLGNRPAAIAAWKRIVERYPESPLAADAAAKMNQGS